MKRINFYLLLLLLFLLPTQLGKHFFFDFSYLNGVRVDYLAPTIYLTDLIVFLLLIFNIKAVVEFFNNKKILIFLGLLIINIFFSLVKPLAVYRFIKIVEFLALLAIIKKNKLPGKNILIAFFFSGILQLILVILQFINKHAIQGIFYFFGERSFLLSTPGIAKASLNGIEFLRPYGTFSHPNSLAGFYLLLYFYFLINKKYNEHYILKNFSLLVFSILIFFSFSKIAILAYLILNTSYLFFNTKNNCRICFVGKILIPIIIALIFISAKTDPFSLPKRIGLIKNSFLIIGLYPIFGTGIGNYLIAQKNFAAKYYNFINQPVHNIFLLAMAELGIPLFVILLIMLKKPLLKLFKNNLFVILTVLTTGFFDHYWLTLQQNFILLSFTVCQYLF